ncbi:MAG: alpha/beta hydrolase [Candidatus Electrothrix sp. AR3]|nr:alpha/beta hydrolase [Candidatus Electrothrix sp. AR3]
MIQAFPKNSVLLLLGMLISIVARCDRSNFTSTFYEDIAYANFSTTQQFDLYLPAGTGPFPVLLNIHGGGFKIGDKGMLSQPLAKAGLNAGYAIASMNYRLSEEATFPAALVDAKAAVIFLRANAKKYKLNPNKIAVFGQSAGGYLAAMLGTTGEVRGFAPPWLDYPTVSSRVQAVISWYGPNDLGLLDIQAEAQGCSASKQVHNAPDSFESLYLGAPVSTVPELVQKANPITYLSQDDPPFLIQSGDQDCIVPIENSKMLADALQAAGMEVQYDLLQKVGHGDGWFTAIFEHEDNIQTLLYFLDIKLK